MSSDVAVRLTHGDWSLTLRPDLGASVMALTWRGRNVLRPAPDDAADPLATGSFPLAPYANRIDHGRFEFQERKVVLPPTPGFEPHVLHGLAWRRPWSVTRQDASSVELALDVAAQAEWPWAWTAAHRISLSDDGVMFDLSMTNADVAPMPAGLGLHPYFVAEADSILTLAADGVWLTENDIPTRLAPSSAVVDWKTGQSLASAPFVDHAYSGWTSVARLDHGDSVVELTAGANAPWVQVYAPGEGGFVCIEPVTHRPDAHNAPAGEAAGVTVLDPGQTLSLSARIAVHSHTEP